MNPRDRMGSSLTAILTSKYPLTVNLYGSWHIVCTKKDASSASRGGSITDGTDGEEGNGVPLHHNRGTPSFLLRAF